MAASAIVRGRSPILWKDRVVRKRKPAPPPPEPFDPAAAADRKSFTKTLFGVAGFQVHLDIHTTPDKPVCMVEFEDSPLATEGARRRVREEIVEFFGGDAQVFERADAEGRMWWRTYGYNWHRPQRSTDKVESGYVRSALNLD